MKVPVDAAKCRAYIAKVNATEEVINAYDDYALGLYGLLEKFCSTDDEGRQALANARAARLQYLSDKYSTGAAPPRAASPPALDEGAAPTGPGAAAAAGAGAGAAAGAAAAEDDLHRRNGTPHASVVQPVRVRTPPTRSGNSELNRRSGHFWRLVPQHPSRGRRNMHRCKRSVVRINAALSHQLSRIDVQPARNGDGHQRPPAHAVKPVHRRRPPFSGSCHDCPPWCAAPRITLPRWGHSKHAQLRTGT